jgi:hypothetical protein
MADVTVEHVRQNVEAWLSWLTEIKTLLHDYKPDHVLTVAELRKIESIVRPFGPPYIGPCHPKPGTPMSP